MSSFLYQNLENPNEIIRDTPWGDIPAWKASSLATGTMGAYTEYLKQIRADSTLAHDAINAREDAVSQREACIAAREALIHDAVTKVHALLHRCDSIITDAEKRRADAEREQQEQEDEPPPGFQDEGELEVHPAKTGELPHDLQPPSTASPVPDDDDDPEVLQRAPTLMQNPDEPQIPPTEFQE
jgi:hypothetical protein